MESLKYVHSDNYNEQGTFGTLIVS